VSARRVGAIVAVALACSLPAVARAATGSGSGRLGGGTPELGVGLLVSTAGDGAGHEIYGAGDEGAPRPVFTRAVPATSGDGVAGLSNLCKTPNGPTGPEYEIGNGWWFDIELFATADGHYLATIATVCQPLAAPFTEPVAPVLTQPPTIGEIWQSVGLPAPAIGVSPEAKGYTGLASWVWAGGSAQPVTIAVQLGGFTISGTAHIIGYGAFPGEGGWVRSRNQGGPGDPAFAHTYERTGTYRLGVATLWSAATVLTGPGLAAPLTIDLGTAVVTNARDYPVVSVRSRLTG
jgi:hypothetical protein